MDKSDQKNQRNPSQKSMTPLGAQKQSAQKRSVPNSMISAQITPDDPFIYASMINNLLGSGSPLNSMVNEVSRAIRFITHTRKETREQIAQLEAQAARIQNHMNTSINQSSGKQIDKTR